MTAQICILNRTAVAMASDSAVTVSIGHDRKIFPSANKLFMLSKYYPVGIMAYGNSYFMGISWETLIKIYRKQRLGKKHFNTLIEYADDFLIFLESSIDLFSEEQQSNFITRCVYEFFLQIRRSIRSTEKSRLKENPIDEAEIKRIVRREISRYHDKLQKSKDIQKVFVDVDIDAYLKTLSKKYSKTIADMQNEVFEKIPLSKSDTRKLKDSALKLFVKEYRLLSSSGVVFSGFGEKDIFPSLEERIVDGIAENKLKHMKYKSMNINFELSAAIVPFAQSEMVHTFMSGVDPLYENFVEKNIAMIVDNLADKFVDCVKDNSSDNISGIKHQISKISKEIVEQFVNALKKYRDTLYSDPIMSIVDALPKLELAGMAESLVNLTSFKRKVSSEAETVGGPIDVAVISKDDGFIWIKRKHYFKREYNYHFFKNYFKEAGNE